MPDVLDNPQKQSIDEFLGENPKIDDFLGPEPSAPVPSVADIVPYGPRGTTSAPTVAQGTLPPPRAFPRGGPIVPEQLLGPEPKLAQDTPGTEEYWKTHPVQLAAKAFGQVGKAIAAIPADIGTGESPLQGGIGENVRAVISGEKPPYLQRAELPGVPKSLALGQKFVSSAIESVPKMASVAGAQAVGIPAPVAAALVFGFDEEGNFSPQQAGIAAVLPLAGKWGGALSETVASRLNIGKPAALDLINAGGRYTTANAILAAQNIPGWSKMTDSQKQDAVAGILVNGFLGLADFTESKDRTGKIDLSKASAEFKAAAEKAKKGIAPIEARIAAKQPTTTEVSKSTQTAPVSSQPLQHVALTDLLDNGVDVNFAEEMNRKWTDETEQLQAQARAAESAAKNAPSGPEGDALRKEALQKRKVADASAARETNAGSFAAALRKEKRQYERDNESKFGTPEYQKDIDEFDEMIKRHQDTADEVVYHKTKKVKESYATQKGQIEGDIQQQRQRADAQRLSTEAGAGNRVQSETPVVGAPQPKETGPTGAPPAPVRNALTTDWRKIAESPGAEFDALSKQHPQGVTGWAYDLAANITPADFEAINAEASRIGKENMKRMLSGEAQPAGLLKPQMLKEAVRMRQAMDEAKSTGAKTEAELAAIGRKYGVGAGGIGDDAAYAKTLRDMLANEPKPEQITAAAVKTPEGKVETGPHHPGILKRLGIKGFENRESRNTPNFGFVTDTGRFVTRPEAAELAKKSGQQLEQFDVDEKGVEQPHSDEIASPTQPKKPISETKPAKRSPTLTGWFPRSDGVPDILDAINELGGIASPSQSAFKGGEYDAYKEAFGSGMAMRLRSATGGHAPDRLMKQLEDYGFKFETADQFYDAVKQANESRKNLRGQAAAEEAQLRQEQEQHEDFRKSVVQGKGTTAPAKTAGDILAVGSTFTHGGETFTVKEYDPDSDTYLVEDGRRFGRQYLSADDPIHPDPGSLTGEQTTEFTPKESLKLEAPESVDEQNQRLAAEKKARDEKAAAEAAAADARAKAGGRTGGNLGSAGQGGLFEQTGQGEIFQPPPPKSPDVGPGMGAATPAEFGPQGQTATGFKNATVDRERAARGLPPAIATLRRSFGEVWDRAMALIDQDPELQDNLIEELRNKPRALTDVEDALLLHRQVDLQNEYAKETRAMAQAFDDGRLDAVEEGKARLARWSDQLLDIYDIGKTAGTETARGLNARKMMVNEDFSLAQMELSKRAANKGRPLTEAETAEIQRLHDKIAETQKAYDDYVARTQEKIAALEAANALNQAKTDVSASRQQTGTRSPKDINQRAAETTAKIVEKLKSGNKDEVTGLVQKLARIFVERGITDREKLIDAIHDVLKGGLPDITRRETMDAISGYGDFKPLRQDQVSATLRDLKGQMQQIGKLLDFFQGKAPKKTGPERRVPSDIERGLLKVVNEAKKRFGLTATDPARQLKSSLDAIKTRLRNQISDLESQINSRQKTVNERAPAPEDAESKALLEQRDKLKTEFDEIFGTPELTDAQRVKGALASLERQSTELERQIKEGDIFAAKRESRTPSTPELEAAKARRDALKSEREYLRESIQPKERRTPEERALLALKTRLTNRTAELKAKLAAGDFASKPRRTVAFDSEAMRLKAENERVKQEYQRGLLLDELKHRTPFEKMQDTLVKWRRAFLLSGPVTLAKLTSAAIQRVTITPIEEAIGAGISRAFPELAKRAPREGGLAVSAEAKALTDGFTKGMKDAWDVLKTGKSELDVLYGKPNALPREAIDFFGNLHGALKTVTKRNEFSRSLAKRMQNAIANGVDATDPLVQTRLAQEAYRDANRSIFMQDNRVVSAYRRAIGALEQKSKITGKTPVAGKIAGTTARILLPIVKIPTNIVAETMQYATGSVTGSVRLANAFRNGIENLPPEHADLIMRDLKKGSLGAAVMLLGFLSPGVVGGYYQPGERRKKGDVKPGNARIFGKNIPSYLLHNPLLETLQIGATIRRVADSKLHRRDTGTQGIGAGVMAGALGLSEEVPFVREQLETAKAFNPQQRGAFFGELTKSMGVPQAVQWAAREWDTDSDGNPISRKPNGVWEHIETGVPGLRQKVKRGPSQP